MSDSIPILMYHQIAPKPLPVFQKYTVTPKAFAKQMSWLARAGYKTIDLDTWLAHRHGKSNLPKQPVILTFDDGYRDCVEYAVPILQSHGFTAIFYLVAGLMGKTTRWLQSERGIEFPLTDWTAARRLVATGFQCGAHTMTHPRLANLSAEACRQELAGSRRVLQDNLEYEVRHLAYPFGSFNEQVKTIAAETGYRSACTVECGFSTPRDTALELQRIPVTGHDTLMDFIWRLRTAYPLGEWLRAKKFGAYQRFRQSWVRTTT